MAIKKIDPKAIVKLVSIQDDAIDLTKSNLKEYAETHDISKLVFKEGESPTLFHCINVGVEKQSELKNKHYKVTPPTIGEDGKPTKARVDVVDESSMMIEYFKAGVKKIEENGTETPVVLDEIPFMIVQEIGSYVMLRATLGDRLKKTSK